MSKVYVQNSPVVWESTTAQGATASSSGSMLCGGYARITGVHWASASADSASGLRVWQSADYGANWDYWTDYVPIANSGSAFSVEIIGNAVKVAFKPHSAAASVRTCWRLRPI